MSEESIGTKAMGALKDNPLVNYFKENKTAYQILVIVLACSLLAGFIITIKVIVVALYKAKMRKPWLIKGSKNAKNSLNIPQDPSDPNSIPTNEI